MKYIISETQNDRIINLIKTVGNRYVYPPYIVKTEVEVGYNDKHEYYYVWPTFYVDHDTLDGIITGSWLEIHKHMLSDYIESFVGVPVISQSYTFKKIKK